MNSPTFGWLNFWVHPHHFKSQFYFFKSPLVAAWSLFSRVNRVAPTFCRWWFWTLHLPQFLPKRIIWGVGSNPFVGYYTIYNHYYCRLLYIYTNSYIYIYILFIILYVYIYKYIYPMISRSIPPMNSSFLQHPQSLKELVKQLRRQLILRKMASSMASVCASADEAKENRMRRPWLFGSRRTKKGGSINGGTPLSLDGWCYGKS